MEEENFLVTLIKASLFIENYIIKYRKAMKEKVPIMIYAERGILGENSLYKVLVKTIPEL